MTAAKLRGKWLGFVVVVTQVYTHTGTAHMEYDRFILVISMHSNFALSKSAG